MQFKPVLFKRPTIYTHTLYIYMKRRVQCPAHPARSKLSADGVVIPELSLFSHTHTLKHLTPTPHPSLVPWPGFCQLAAEHLYSDVLQMAQALVQNRTVCFASPCPQYLLFTCSSLSGKASPSIQVWLFGPSLSLLAARLLAVISLTYFCSLSFSHCTASI